MANTAIQLYSLRNVDLAFDELLGRVADAGFDGVEFAYRVVDEDPEAVAETIDEVGLDVAGAHVPIDSLETSFDETIAFYETLGCDNIVIPSLPQDAFTSRDAIVEAVERLAALEPRVTDRGHAFHYHNHHWEFTPIDGTTGFDIFLEESDVNVEIDVGLALLGGDDPVARIRNVGDRCRLLHLKDVNVEEGTSTPLGHGDLDIAACTSAFSDVDGEWLIYEFEGEDPLASLGETAAEMRSLV